MRSGVARECRERGDDDRRPEELEAGRLVAEEEDAAAYASAVLATVGGTRQAIFFTDRNTLGLDVATGRILWVNYKVNNNTANIATPVVSGSRVFLSSAYDTGAVLLDLLRHRGWKLQLTATE